MSRGFGRNRVGRINKYGVAPRERRTYNGVVYHSRTEMLRAMWLDEAVRFGIIQKWERQVSIPLGPDCRTVVDFVVWTNDGASHAEEVKGFETASFKKIRRLWSKYGVIPLWIVKKRSRWTVESIEGMAG